MTEASARYQAVRRCVACHERLTDHQVWDSNGVCPHCGEVTDSDYCDTYTTSEARDSSQPLRAAFETAVRRGLEVRGIRLVSLTPTRIPGCDGLPAWEACIKVGPRGLKAKLTLGGFATDPYIAPESLVSEIAEGVADAARPRALAPAQQLTPVHGTFINDLRLLLADLGISAMWKAGLTRVRRLLTVGVRLRR